VTDDKRELPVGLYPWNVAITPDGRRALVNNMGAEGGSDGNVDTVTVIDLANDPARVVQHVTVGDAPEGLAITASGTLAVVTLLQGSYDAPPSAWFRHEAGRVVVCESACYRAPPFMRRKWLNYGGNLRLEGGPDRRRSKPHPERISARKDNGLRCFRNGVPLRR